jgi:OTU-like cysteine protease
MGADQSYDNAYYGQLSSAYRYQNEFDKELEIALLRSIQDAQTNTLSVAAAAAAARRRRRHCDSQVRLTGSLRGRRQHPHILHRTAQQDTAASTCINFDEAQVELDISHTQHAITFSGIPPLTSRMLSSDCDCDCDCDCQTLSITSTGNENGTCVIRRMPADNSCLFHAIGYCCEKGGGLPREAVINRYRVVHWIKTHGQEYNHAILGRPVQSYCRNILDYRTWGGAIEIAILSNFFQVEIFTFDVTQPSLYRVGQNKGYDKRIFLLYYGQHYDVIAFRWHKDKKPAAGAGIGRSVHQRFFSTHDEDVRLMAKRLVELLYIQHHTDETFVGTVKWKGQQDELGVLGMGLLREFTGSDGKSTTLPDNKQKSLQQQHESSGPAIAIAGAIAGAGAGAGADAMVASPTIQSVDEAIPMSINQSPSSVFHRSQHWTCSSCAHMNRSSSIQCEVCNAWLE